MKKTVIKIIIYIAACLLVPFLITMLMTGICEEQETDDAAKTVILNYDSVTEITDVTDYITRTVAAYYEADDGTEFVKALAVMVRTCIDYVKEDKAMVDSAAIAMTTLSEQDMKKLWGDKYEENYDLIRLAVNETAGKIITYNDSPIAPYFHKYSSGKTRNGSEDYIKAVDCSEDLVNENYLNIVSVPIDKKVKKLFNGYSVNEAFQVIERDDTGYVTDIMVGGETMSGETFCKLFNLPSANFTIAVNNDKITFTVRGRGSGYGLSLNAAREKAIKGQNYEEILCYFYKNIQIINE